MRYGKRRDLYDKIENVILHLDNAHSNTASRTQLEIDVVGLQRVVHLPYSPDLAPLDVSYFPQLKAYLRGTRFGDQAEIMYAIQRLTVH